jgi:DNA-binding transcriptional LysR family regulator
VLAVERFGSNAEAARRLEVDEATVSRRVARSEDVLGTQLFERMRGKLMPTETGRAVARLAENVERVTAAISAAIISRQDLSA